MKTSVCIAVTVLLLVLTGYVTTKAGWFTSKPAEQGFEFKTIRIDDTAQLNEVMNNESAKRYRTGQITNWKLAMLYR